MKAEDILNDKIEREYDRQVSKTVDECFELIRVKMDELRGYGSDTIIVYHTKFPKYDMSLKTFLTSLFDDVERNGKEEIGKRIIKKVEEFFHNEKEL